MFDTQKDAKSYDDYVDGIRAVAVAAVIFFHAGISGFSGGFTGVDVFFVVSGYVITRKITYDLNIGEFSAKRFYLGRIRRLVPALVLMCASTYVSSYFVLFPVDFSEMAKSLIYAILFVSNIHFWMGAGYFTALAEVKPLLHTWSLGVEMQLYLLWPVALASMRQFLASNRVRVIAVFAAGSFAANLYFIGDAPDAVFYLPQFRGWEFLIGSLLAMGGFPPLRKFGSVVTVMGIVAVITGVSFFDKTTQFPGVAALLPCLGTGAIIWGGQSAPTWITRLLSTAVPRFFGKLSYSLYLWHWPVFVLTGYMDVGHNTVGVIAKVVLSILLAYLSWMFVEEPFRRGVLNHRIAASLLVGAAAATLVMGWVGLSYSGFPSRFSAEAATLAAGVNDSSPRRPDCHFSPTLDQSLEKTCVFGDLNLPQIAVWGDSMAVELAWALSPVAGSRGFSVRQVTYSACPPAANVIVGDRVHCPAVVDKILAQIAASSDIRIVILLGRIGGYLEGKQPYEQGLLHVARKLRDSGKRVLLVYPVPEPSFDVPRHLANRVLTGGGSTNFSIETFFSKQAGAFSILDRISERLNLERVYPHKVLCKTGQCETVEGWHPLYFDQYHLSNRGAAKVANLFAGPLAQELPAKAHE